MATHTVFIWGTPFHGLLIGMRCTASWQDNVLTVERDKKLVCKLYAKKGDAFVILCENGRPFVEKLTPPRRKGAIVAWLMGGNKHNRALTEEGLEDILEKERRRHKWRGYYEWEYRGRHYRIIRCNNPCGEERNVGMHISNDISKEEVLKLVPLMTMYPTRYTLGILRENFGIKSKEFRDANLEGVLKPL